MFTSDALLALQYFFIITYYFLFFIKMAIFAV